MRVANRAHLADYELVPVGCPRAPHGGCLRWRGDSISWMLARDALPEFQRYAGMRGVSLDGLGCADLLDLMTGFYRDVRADDCDLDSDGDMLFCTWGTYDWGAGEHFEFTVFRQFFFPPSPGTPRPDVLEDADDYIWHLDVALKFEPTPELRGVGGDGCPCHRLAGLAEFTAAVRASLAYRLVCGRSDGQVTLRYECAG